MNGQEKKEEAAIAAKPVLFVTEEYQNLYNLLQCRWLAIVSLYESKGQDLVFDQQTLEAILNWGDGHTRPTKEGEINRDWSDAMKKVLFDIVYALAWLKDKGAGEVFQTMLDNRLISANDFKIWMGSATFLSPAGLVWYTNTFKQYQIEQAKKKKK